MMINKFGFNCDVSINGLEALKMIKLFKMNNTPYTLDEIEATRQITTLYGEDRPVIIAMTANAFKEDRKLCFEVGMQHFTSKPIKLTTIQDILIEYSGKTVFGINKKSA